MLERELQIEYLKKEGFQRYKCKKCGAYFWSRIERDNCTESPCGEYKFLKEDIFKGNYTVEEMREEFIRFFEKRGHKKLRRYPVVARWRDDVFLVNASIYDFQPHVTSGEVEPPANPLVISQPCIRMIDIDFVGKTGRHLTGFEMMAHHAFNYPDKFIYWKDKTVQYALEFIEQLGGNLDDVVLKEKPWVGGGNAGASFEVIVGGLELATLVFMNLKEDEGGKIEVENTRYSEMPMKIVDTGYGLERFVWVSQRTPTIYDAIYPDMVQKLISVANIERGGKENEIMKKLAYLSPNIEKMGEKKFEEYFIKSVGISRDYYENFIKKIQWVYALVDYTRSLAFMLTDGIVPSNIKSGYLARLLIRRILKILNDLGNPVTIEELVKMHIERFSDIMDTGMLPTVMEELSVEKERYRKTLKRGREIVKRIIKKKKEISVNDLILLYDSHGILPDIVKNIALEDGVNIKIPENFHSLVAMRHERNVEKEKKKERKMNLPKTEMLYYREPYMKEFDARVIWSEDDKIVLDKTAFYPEGGGQPSDRGKIIYNGNEYEVLDVQKYGNVIVHKIKGNISEGSKIHGILDWERRERLMRMHTAEHILLASARRVLGKHVWQHGTQKDVYESRFDIAHYKVITRDEIKRMEEEAMRIITKNIDVEARFMNRMEAEKKYRFVLYEGGIPPGKEIRVVKIGDYDVEACGGTHVNKTGEIGFLKILRTERIQDGVSRIIYSAGLSALEYTQRSEDILIESSEKIKTTKEKLPEKIEKLIEEWKREKKEKEKLMKYKIKLYREEILKKMKNGKVADIVDLSPMEIQKLVRELSKEIEECVLITEEGHIAVYSKNGRARELSREIANIMNGMAGGHGEFAQGRGEREKIKEGLNKAMKIMGLI